MPLTLSLGLARLQRGVLGVALVFLLSLTANAPAHAADTGLLQRYFDGLKTLRADFEQTLYDSNSAPQDKSSGRITVQRPNRFRLEYLKPYHQIYVADGKRLWSYDEDLEQVTVKAQGNVLANTPAMLLSNPRQLNEAFLVSALGEREGMLWYELTPRSKDTNFERVALAFKDDQLRVMVLQDSLGQTTRLDFSHVEYNRPVDTALFHFKPPAGVDVIGEQ